MSRPQEASPTIPSVISQLRNIFPANAAAGYYQVAGVTFRPSEVGRPTIISVQNGDDTAHYLLSQDRIIKGEDALFNEGSRELNLAESQALYYQVSEIIGDRTMDFIPDVGIAAQMQADAQLAQNLAAAPAPAIRIAQAGQLQRQQIEQEEAEARRHADIVFAAMGAGGLDAANHGDRPSPNPRPMQAFQIHFNQDNDMTSGVRGASLEFDRERGGMGGDRTI